MKRILIAAVATLLVLACESTEDPARSIGRTDRRPATVIANAQLVADAIDRYASENGGDYRGFFHMSTSELRDYLGGELLINPYTGERTEPRVCRGPGPGRVGFYTVRPLEEPGNYLGYRVIGWGEDPMPLVVLSAGPDSLVARDDSVVANCLTVVDAAEEWASRNGGSYPTDLSDRGADDLTLLDLLPDGQRLRNPFWDLLTEPKDGAADQTGQTGYVVCTDREGQSVGYTINGWGDCGEIIEFRKCPD
jgi:hypothetical protein